MSNLTETFRVLAKRNDYSYYDWWNDVEDYYTVVELKVGASEEDTMRQISELCRRFDYLAGCIAFSESKENTGAVDIYIISYANGIPRVRKLTLAIKCYDLGHLRDILEDVLDEIVYCEPGYVSNVFNVISYEF